MVNTFLLLCSLASAEGPGDEWLDRIDRTARVASAHLVLDVVVTDSRGRQNPRTIEVWQKGDDKRLVRMVAPARLAGIGLLVSPGEKTHLFLPQYPPARLVVGSKRADAFMGTDFAIEDLSRLTYSSTYTATLGETDGDLTQLTLSQRVDPGAPKTHLWVDDDAVVKRVVHLDKDGNALRELNLSDVQRVGAALLAHTIEVKDTKKGRTTRARIREISVDADIDDAMFSVTELERQ